MSALDDDRGLLAYLERSSQCLPELLRDEEDPLNLLFPDGKLDVATIRWGVATGVHCTRLIERCALGHIG